MKDIEIVVFNDKSWVRLTEYQKLQEENEQLKAQIEKMKNCKNCKYFVDVDIVCNQGLYLGNRDFTECYKWELEE